MISPTFFDNWTSPFARYLLKISQQLAKNRPRLIILLLFRTFLLASLSSCGGSGSSTGSDSSNGSGSNPLTPSSALTTPQILPTQTDGTNLLPSMVFDGTSLQFQYDTDSDLSIVSLPDPDAERASANSLVVNSNGLSGMTVTGNCTYSNVGIAASHGKWKFELGLGCSILQMSDDYLQLDRAIVLDFNIQNSSSFSAQLNVEIVGIHTDGTSTVLKSRLVEIPAHDTGWITKQVSTGFGAYNEYVDQKLGVRFSNISTATTISLDSISLKLFSKKPTDNLVFNDSWDDQCDQLWAGQYFWSNRLQDWQILNKRLQTTDPSAYRPNRTTHRISTEMISAPANFTLAVDTGPVEDSSSGSYSGFLIGAGVSMDYRSAALIHNRHGRNGGLIAGIDDSGKTFFLDNGLGNRQLSQSTDETNATVSSATLQLDGHFLNSGLYRLNLFAKDPDGRITSSTSIEVEPAKLLGNIAIIANPGEGNTAHWFDNWKGAGSKLRERPSRQFGPVLFSSYTVDRKVLTVNAQYPPICTEPQPTPTIEIFQQGEWTEIGSAVIDPQSYTARFSISSWEPIVNTQYRIVTRSNQINLQDNYFYGVVKFIPSIQDELVIGLYNCRPGIINSKTEGWIQQNNNAPFTWTRDRIVFPHEELVENSQKHNPDLLAFLGDQIYEFDPNGLVVKQLPDLTLDYLWKWYQFGWSVRELMRSTPSFVLPDDHDVFQSNVWGQGGGVAQREQDGGYVYPAQFINTVQKTQTGSLPTPFDGTTVDQGISVYYTDIVMGGVGLAILEDRKFKTAPYANQDNPQLLGNRQLEFLEQWSADWEGQSMKIALSQSPFSQSTTHSGEHFDLIGRDKDSNGWPKPGRDRAVQHLRKAFAPHLTGDQHLGLSLKHGVNEYDDAIYSFAAPSMLNIFPRIWDPLNQTDGHGDSEINPLGRYTDQHNNLLTVLAVANPEIYYQSSEPVDMPSKNDLGIGYGIVRVDTLNRQYSFEAWPANINPLDVQAKPYENWPVTFNQTDNDGRIPEGFLLSRIAAVEEPVVQVFKEPENVLEYARRYSSAAVELPVFDREASYRVILSNPATGYREQFDNQRAQ